MPPSSNAWGIRLRRADPDRYLCTLFAPAEKRDALALLYLFNHELARAREVASQPVLALIRLNWWRDVVAGAARSHDIAMPLAQALMDGVFQREDLLALVAAREAEADEAIPDLPAFLAYARGTAGGLQRIAGKVLGADSGAVEDLGTAYGIAGIIRAAPFLQARGRSLLPADGTPVSRLAEEATALLRARPPRVALAAALPAVLAKRDLARLDQPYRPRGLGDRLAVLRAALLRP